MVRWQVWHERTYSATSQSWPTQKARRRTSDPVAASEAERRPLIRASGPRRTAYFWLAKQARVYAHTGNAATPAMARGTRACINRSRGQPRPELSSSCRQGCLAKFKPELVKDIEMDLDATVCTLDHDPSHHH